MELETKDHKNGIDMLKKEEESRLKSIKVLENNLEASQEELEAFQVHWRTFFLTFTLIFFKPILTIIMQRMKQQKLNEVNKVVVVCLHQLQHISEDFRTLNIWETLLFNKQTLSRLYKRVGQLQMETLQQKAKHK